MSSHSPTPVKQKFGTPPLVIEVTALSPSYVAEQAGAPRQYELDVISAGLEPTEGSWRLTQDLFCNLRDLLAGRMGDEIAAWMAEKPAKAPLPPIPTQATTTRFQREENVSKVNTTPPPATRPVHKTPVKTSETSSSPPAVVSSNASARAPQIIIGRRPEEWVWHTYSKVDAQHHRRGAIVPGDTNEVGMLKVLGYSVGWSSDWTERQRFNILTVALCCRLPIVDNAAYTESWGAPQSSDRVRKIRDALRYQIRLKGGELSYAQAVKEWTEDLEWFMRVYGDGIFRRSGRC
jgi:hypothetical protein